MNNIIYTAEIVESEQALGTYWRDPVNGAIYILGRSSKKIGFISLNTGIAKHYRSFITPFPIRSDCSQLIEEARLDHLPDGNIEFLVSKSKEHDIGDIFKINNHFYLTSKIEDRITLVSLLNGNRCSHDITSIKDTIEDLRTDFPVYEVTRNFNFNIKLKMISI